MFSGVRVWLCSYSREDKKEPTVEYDILHVSHSWFSDYSDKNLR